MNRAGVRRALVRAVVAYARVLRERLRSAIPIQSRGFRAARVAGSSLRAWRAQLGLRFELSGREQVARRGAQRCAGALSQLGAMRGFALRSCSSCCDDGVAYCLRVGQPDRAPRCRFCLARGKVGARRLRCDFASVAKAWRVAANKAVADRRAIFATVDVDNASALKGALVAIAKARLRG